MDTTEIQNRMSDFWKARGVPQTTRQLVVGLCGESAEVLDLFRFTEVPDEKKLAFEALDALICSLGILHALGVDIESLFNEKIADIEKRYPVDEFIHCAEDYVRLHNVNHSSV